jgi:hypothetical protein
MGRDMQGSSYSPIGGGGRGSPGICLDEVIKKKLSNDDIRGEIRTWYPQIEMHAKLSLMPFSYLKCQRQLLFFSFIIYGYRIFFFRNLKLQVSHHADSKRINSYQFMNSQFQSLILKS